MSDDDASDTHGSAVLSESFLRPGSLSRIRWFDATSEKLQFWRGYRVAVPPAKSQFSHEELESSAFCSYEAESALVKNVPVNA